MSETQLVCQELVLNKGGGVAITSMVTNRDYAMHRAWIRGAKTPQLAKDYQISERTVQRRIKLVEIEIGTVKAKEDILSALSGIGPDAWAGLHTHVKNGNLEAILNVLRHLGMGQDGGDGGYVEVTDEELYIEEQIELRNMLERSDGNGPTNGAGTPVSVSAITKRTRVRKKTVRGKKTRKA